MKIMEPVHRPWTWQHILWHFIFDILSIIDGVLGVLSLGLRNNTLVLWMYKGGLNFLFDHEKWAEEEAKRDEEMKRHVLGHTLLGLTDEQMNSMSDEQLRTMVNDKILSTLRGAVKDLENTNNDPDEEADA